MKERGKVIVLVLISIIIILSGILAYGVYTGFKVKAELIRLNAENQNLSSELENLQGEYALLIDDVAEIYKTCLTENVCKGRYPGTSWYCNNVGNEVDDPSHLCVCDASCNLNSTSI